MISPVQVGTLSEVQVRFPIRVRNITLETIPPYGVMQLAGATTFGQEPGYAAILPTGANNAEYVLNSPAEIPPNGYGSATDQYPADAAYQYNLDAQPALNAEWGPVFGSWLLSASGKGFLILGGADQGVVRVSAKSGTSAGDDFPLVRILNTTGLPRAYGSISAYGTPLDPPPGTLYRIPSFQSLPPQPGKPFVVTLAPSAVNQIVDAAPVGVVAVQINFTDATHTHADAIANDFDKLRSAKTGPALILWREKQSIVGEGTLGIQWARVRLDAEKYRLVRGTVYVPATPEDKFFVIKNIIPLASGLDPRANPLDPNELLNVANVHDQTYHSGSLVTAVYSLNVEQTPAPDPQPIHWEAMKNITVGAILTAFANGTVPAGLANAPAVGVGKVYEIGPEGVPQTIGLTEVLYNPLEVEIPDGKSCTVSRITDHQYLVIGYAKDASTNLTCQDIVVVTNVACTPQGMSQTKETFKVAVGPCP
jgi:hypothetical protein